MDKPVEENPYLLTVDEWLATEGQGMSRSDFLGIASGGMFYDDYGPALCRAGCNVESSGLCTHGCPSVLRAFGLKQHENGHWISGADEPVRD